MLTRTVGILATFLFVLCVEASAIEMDVAVGFGGQCKPGTWVPISVRLRNPTDAAIKGFITTLDQINEQPSPYRTPFELYGSSEKRYTHYALLDQIIGAPTVVLVPESGRLRANEGIARTTVHTLQPDNPFILVAGPPRASLNFLNGTPLPAIQATAGGGTIPRSISSTIIDPALLPDRPLGYDGVEMLVLHDFMPSKADPKQLAALKMWVAGGGTLVVSGGPNFQLLQNEFYADLLPVKVTGATELPGLGSLARSFKRPIESGSVALTDCTVRPGATPEISQDGAPIVSSWSYGLGQVTFLAFDYSAFPLKGWDGQVDLWKETLLWSRALFPLASPAAFSGDGSGMGMPMPPSAHPVPGHRRYYRSAYGLAAAGSNPLERIAGHVQSVTTPSLEVIALFLLGYLVCLVPINYFILTRKKRRELAWLTTPAIIVVFTLGAYGTGYAMKGGRLQFRTLTVAEGGPNSRFAAKTTYAGLFSPSRRTYEVQISDPYAVASGGASELGHNWRARRREIRHRLNFLMGETTTLPDVAMNMWSVRTFCSESGCDLGGTVESDLRLDGQRIMGVLRNNTGHDLTRCRLVVNGGQIGLSDLDAGSTVTVDEPVIAAASSMPAPGGGSMPVPGVPPVSYDDADDPRPGVEAQIVTQLGVSDRPVLVAWGEEGMSAMKLRPGGGTRQELNCFVIRLDTGGGKHK